MEDNAGRIHNILKAVLPPAAKPGDVLTTTDGDRFIIDSAETAKRADNARRLMDEILKNE